MPNPTTNFRTSSGTDLGNLGWITKEYLMSVYPQIAGQLITPELWVWGQGFYGELGNNSGVNRSTPVTTFAGEANWKDCSSGYNFSVAIKNDGTLWTWGAGTYGRLGNFATTNRSTPITTFAGGTNWKQVSVGGGHCAAIKTDGTLWLWGGDFYSQAVHGDNTSTAPQQKCTPITTFAGGTNWKQVSCGGVMTAAIKTDGTLWTWGRSGGGGLGNNATNTVATPITTFAGGTNWKQVSCSLIASGSSTSDSVAAVKTDGTLWTWGRNAYGQLGNNTITDSLTPITTFAGGTNWKQVSCGNGIPAAIKTDGTLWVWGRALGDNTSINRSTPVTTFAGGTNWKQVATGNIVAAIKTDGTLWVWGGNNVGQLGDNTITSRSTPVTTFAGGTNWKRVANSRFSTLAIKTSDDLQGI